MPTDKQGKKPKPPAKPAKAAKDTDDKVVPIKPDPQIRAQIVHGPR